MLEFQEIEISPIIVSESLIQIRQKFSIFWLQLREASGGEESSGHIRSRNDHPFHRQLHPLPLASSRRFPRLLHHSVPGYHPVQCAVSNDHRADESHHTKVNIFAKQFVVDGILIFPHVG